ncbi:MAG: UDP-4-amino-4,6-dideoxy-N-acetyl-beta-L-altrosamine transaminase [Burkholderiaceae bacterium]|nr:UDP-4-amino-4,6-dideoxy-N-acetyl-beta-L-altrosamine transaminase [Burkholderiaceae bacterium]
MIPYGRQDITQGDIDAVRDVLVSDFLTQGPQVPRFEASVREATGVAHAFAMNSATSALHVACLALGLGPGDTLWTSPITFVASSNCALYCGASVDFVDIDPVSFNMSPEALRTKLEAAQVQGKLPKVVVPVHLCGQPCNMEAIGALAQEFGFKVIEDASHAIGGRYQDEPIGNCRYSDMTIFSFHPVKIVTSAEGGMLLTNNAELASKVELFRSHGITRDASLMVNEPHGPWYYEQVALGYNYRMTELQAALGVSQMGRLTQYVRERNELAKFYDKALESLPLSLPVIADDAYSAFHLYVIRLKLDELSRSHREVFEALRAGGVGVNLHYMPVYHQPYYASMGFDATQFPHAEAYYGQAISIPMYPTIGDDKRQRVVDVLKSVLS